jgi:hypothetical protein
VLLFFVIAIRSCIDVNNYKKAKDAETVKRFEFDENLKKCSDEKGAVEQKLQKVTQDLEAEKTEHDATKKTLLQEQLVSQSLKEELGKVNKLKETLEENLKNALVREQGSQKVKK